MRTAVGIFTSRADAERAVADLRSLGITDDHLNMLIPGAPGTQTESVPTTDAEQPGIGKALGGVVGGAAGASGGLFASAIISATVPGVGAITGIGLAAAALLGAGGVAAGAAAGGALEYTLSEGVPKDEIFVYEDALKQGYTVLFVLADDASQRHAALQILAAAGAEELDTARKRWWIGLLDPEEQVYKDQAKRTAQQDKAYQRGIEAALAEESHGKAYDEATPYLQVHYGDVYKDEAFQRGYERCRAYSENFGKRWAQAVFPGRNDK